MVAAAAVGGGSGDDGGSSSGSYEGLQVLKTKNRNHKTIFYGFKSWAKTVLKLIKNSYI